MSIFLKKRQHKSKSIIKIVCWYIESIHWGVLNYMEIVASLAIIIGSTT